MKGEAAGKLREFWGEAFAGAVEAMAGERPSVRWVAAEAGPEEPVLWWEQGLNLCSQPAAWVGAPESAWQMVGNRVLTAAGVEQAPAEDVRDTWTELLTQTFSALGQRLAAVAGTNISISSGKIVAEPPAGAEVSAAEIRFADEGKGRVYIAFAEQLGGLFESWIHAAGAGAELAKEGREEGAGHSYKTLDLLKDVELPVSVSFGRTQMALQDVLKLSAGSIIELDRTIDEPVALIVNDTVVALGEVVVIEGNYGLRIQKIMSREDLLRTSGIR